MNGARARPAAEAPALPASLVVMPVSRHPTTLDPSTLETVLRRPVPSTTLGPSAAEPRVSVVVLARDGLPLTRMCLESVLQEDGTLAELIVVDNASQADARDYLATLAEQNPIVRPVFNEENLAFAAAINKGLSLARGDVLVMLNNDTIVTPGWLDGLARHLEDPGVGLVGPVTNHVGNEARIEVPYRTYGELLEFARDRAEAYRGQAFDIPVSIMFCTALRRDVYAEVGPLDERFAVAMFEDDDYSLRVEAAGLRVLCAEDVFIHHFGTGTLGERVATGEFDEILEANRQRFEEKWGRKWEPHTQRRSSEWTEQVDGVRALIEDVADPGAVVLVVSRGENGFLDLDARTGWHFPRDDGGAYSGFYPADSEEAIGELERQRSLGATHLVFPASELWWLDHYGGLLEHLDRNHRRVSATRTGVAYELLAARAEPR